MGYSKEKIKQICGLMLFGAFLVLAVMYSNRVIGGILFAVDISMPFIIGGAIAFVLNLPMKGIEDKILAKWNGKVAKRLKRPVSILLSIIIVLLILYVVISMVVPQLIEAVIVLGNKIPPFLNGVVTWLQSLTVNYPGIEEQIASLYTLQINWDTIVDSVAGFLKNGVANMLTSTVSVATGIIGGVVNMVISLIFAIYILSQKERIGNQGKRIITAYFSERMAARILRVFSLLHRNFSSFVSGQCIEAVILGTMFVVTMSIFKMPYAVMVGVLIAFTALIPVVGAFVGCVVGAFLIMIESPIMAIWFVVLFLVLQQIEGNLIYPKVVGNSVGLPAVWVLLAVSLGGSLFGVAGMLLFIPIAATVYTLVRENVNARNARKEAVVVAEENAEKSAGEKAGENTEENAKNDDARIQKTEQLRGRG